MNKKEVEKICLEFMKMNLIEMKMLNNLIFINNEMYEYVDNDFSDIINIGKKCKK